MKPTLNPLWGAKSLLAPLPPKLTSKLSPQARTYIPVSIRAAALHRAYGMLLPQGHTLTLPPKVETSILVLTRDQFPKLVPKTFLGSKKDQKIFLVPILT